MKNESKTKQVFEAQPEWRKRWSGMKKEWKKYTGEIARETGLMIHSLYRLSHRCLFKELKILTFCYHYLLGIIQS